MTAHVMQDDVKACFAAGMSAFLAKPVLPRSCITAGNATGAQRRARCPARHLRLSRAAGGNLPLSSQTEINPSQSSCSRARCRPGAPRFPLPVLPTDVTAFCASMFLPKPGRPRADKTRGSHAFPSRIRCGDLLRAQCARPLPASRSRSIHFAIRVRHRSGLPPGLRR